MVGIIIVILDVSVKAERGEALLHSVLNIGRQSGGARMHTVALCFTEHVGCN